MMLWLVALLVLLDVHFARAQADLVRLLREAAEVELEDTTRSFFYFLDIGLLFFSIARVASSSAGGLEPCRGSRARAL